MSQPLFYPVLNVVSDGVFKENVQWKNNISFKNDTEKIVLILQMKDLMQIFLKFRAEKILCRFLLSTKHPFEGHEILCTKTTV